MHDQHNKEQPRRRGRFERASGLLQSRIRKASESRGFAVSRLLTHWEEVVGEETARIALPVNVSYSQGGMGATLTLLTTGAHAPILQADLPRLKDRVNACYGYSAISRIRITQTAPTGFSEGQVAFAAAPAPEKTKTDTAAREKAREAAHDIGDDSLRTALEELGKNILSRAKR